MADNYKITQYSVSTILGYVENSQIAIPEIQRPFVWKGQEVRDLIDSLYEGYPIGYLIVWQNSQVRIRGFGKGGTKKILIDGQQRVTALMAALLGREVLDSQYRSHRIKIAFYPLAQPGEEKFAVSDASYEDKPGWIPDISVLFRRDFSFRKFEKEYKEKNPDLDTSLLEAAIDRLKGIVKHQVGVIELSFLLDIDVVSEIFIRINLQGKPLNQEDFAMSKISVNEQYDGDLIRNCIDYFCHLIKEPSFMTILKANEKEFMETEYGRLLGWLQEGEELLYVPSYSDVLKVVLIAGFGKSKIGDLVNLLSGKTKDKTFARGEVSQKVAKEAFETLGRGVRAFVSEENYKGFLKALRRAGYTSERLLYSQAVLNYCYAMYLLMDMEGLPSDKKESLMGRWMTMCLITGHYQSTPDTVVMKDYKEIREAGMESYLRQIEELRLGEEFFASVLPEKFTSTTARTAPYLAYLAAQTASGTLSLYSGENTVGGLYAAKAEAYQILPKAYLEKCGFKTRETYGQVANLTYISKEVKAIVRRKSPADYREELEKQLSAEEIQASLAANDIPENIFDADAGSVPEILAERRRKMARKIQNHYYSL
ncbi:DUF262 domain-containing protein [Eubacterium sp. An3]|uniref:GmrSD restriction endonuclease domain-containing protein n=1 Tax=Eubacterium sp. An3 TaxID=1965628 RepID=UPI000B3A10AF|nr:DUF262 domain-containing protein [Eubacterium sp. An3]OUO29515.1 hypothetical protein B5F87_03145 [Eubacterium sp. An3]